jgi:sugar phosphate isomerase/epimerase
MQQTRLSRRGFLGAVGGAAAAAALSGPLASTVMGSARLVPPGHLGIQLFTVRDRLRVDRPDGLGFQGLFEALSSFGYKEIEFAGYNDRSGATLADIRQMMVDNDMTGIGTHVGYSSFLNDINEVLDEAEALGLPYVGTANNPGRYGNTVDGYKQASEDFNNFGAAAAARGMRWYQHNHDGEFQFDDETGDRLYDVLLAETDPDLVFLQMDIFWAYAGQYQYSEWTDPSGVTHPRPFEPLDYVKAYPERYPLFHVKDGTSNPESSRGYDFANVGEGDIDFRTFFDEMPKRGYHHFIMERDNASSDPDGGSLHSAQVSAEYLLDLRA